MSLTIPVYAPLGLTVELSTGAIITDSGATVIPTNEILELLSRRELVNQDPTGDNPDPSPLPADEGAGVVSLPVLTLAVQTSTDTGAIAASYGGSTVLDGQEGFWLRDPASVATADTGTILGSGTGRWRRFRERTNFYNVMWYGAKNTGADNPLSGLYANWAAISAAYPHIQKNAGESDAAAYTRVGAWDVNDAVISKVIALASPGCAEVYFPAGVYRITRPIVMSTLTGTDNINRVNNGNGVNNLKLRGANMSSPWHPQTKILWDGLDSTLPMIFATGADHIIECLALSVKWGRTAFSAVEVGWDTTTTRFVHGIIVRDCYIWADGDTDYWTDGNLTHGVTIGAYQPTGLSAGLIASLEDCRITHCLFRSMQDSMIWVAAGQPFNTIIEHCRFWQYRGAGLVPGEPLNIHPYGSGIRVTTPSTDVHIQNCEFQAPARVLDLQHPAPVTMTGCTGENVKRLLHSPVNSPNTGTPIRIEGGRWYARIDQASRAEDPSGSLAANAPWILHVNNNQVSLNELFVTCAYTETEFTLRFAGDCHVVITACTFPFASFLRRENANSHIGKTFITGCQYAYTSTVSGAEYRPIGTYTGCNTPNGYVVITGAATTATVTLDTYTREEDRDYLIQLTAGVESGSPTMSTPYFSNRTNTTFQINLPSAPGGVAAVRVYYHLSR